MPLTTVDQGLLSTNAQYTGFKNRIINGNMRIDQRNGGASVTANSGTSAYTLDRFGYNNSSGATFTVQQSSVAPAGFNNSMLLTVTSANSPSSSQFFRIFQGIEGFNFADFGFGTANAQPVTISFWAFSNTAGTYGYALNNAAGNRAYAASYTLAANTWTYVTSSIPGDTSGTWPGATNAAAAYLTVGLGSGSNGEISAGSWQTVGAYINQPTGTNDLCATNGATLYVTGVQLEKGSAATSFDVRSYGTELQLCQRYCWGKNASTGNTTNWNILWYSGKSRVSITSPVPMRAAVTATFTGSTGGAFFSTNDDANYRNFSYDGTYSEASGVYPTIQISLTDSGGSAATTGGGMAYLQNGRSILFTSEF
jgi:hypothetical protein